MKQNGSVMNKPFSLGYTILELSKLLLEKFIMMKFNKTLAKKTFNYITWIQIDR